MSTVIKVGLGFLIGYAVRSGLIGQYDLPLWWVIVAVVLAVLFILRYWWFVDDA